MRIQTSKKQKMVWGPDVCSRRKIYDDASDHRIIDILDLKVDPELGGILRGKEGYFPAYHMNKEHWISVDLRKIEKLDELASLIDGSFKSTQ